jgi:uracil-DNA glycosylase family 4
MENLENIKYRIKTITESYKDDLTGGWIVGGGPIPADILFVGEAPGKTEIEKNEPFVGMAGKTFDKYLTSIGVSREDVRITNACFFRPIKKKVSSSGNITISNRPPKESELDLFKEVLEDQITLVNPRVIITLGNIPLKRLTNFKSIGQCHGELYFNDRLKKHIFPMYHPSSLTYNRTDEFLKTYENDWEKLKQALII